MRQTAAVVLAAGKGTRLHSEQFSLPKVMRSAAGRPLLAWVLEALGFLPPEQTILVVGYKREQVLEAFPAYPAALQEEQLGTGHAVMCARDALRDFEGDILVCCGDMPLLGRAGYEALLAQHRREGNACTLLSGRADRPLAYGRVIRDGEGTFLGIVEDRDCTPEQKAVTELNAGVYVFRSGDLWPVLEGLGRDNAQGEYYLTDAPTLIAARGGRVNAVCACTGEELLGVNTPEQLAEAERILAARDR